MSDQPGAISNGDAELLARIDALVAEEHRLERAHSGSEVTEAEKARLEDLSVQLDQLWDLLRQRRARRHAGQDPSEAAVRPGDVVEHYRQ